MKQEIWKDIEGYKGLYEVSNLGNVKSLGNGNSSNSKERILNGIKESKGYLKVNLFKNGKKKQFKIHRLVAEAFIPNPQNLPEVNHIDEDKTNNSVDNLEWCTNAYNNNHGTRNERIAKSNTNGKKSKRVLCIETGIVYPSLSEVQRKHGFAHQQISKCCNGKHRTAYNYHWRYVE